jgi:3-hydroxyacyl-CoA dehydrogenase
VGEIETAAVVGAGTMGSGIAGHLANAGVPVVLLDIVPQGAAGGPENRDVIAETAVERLLASSPPALMHPDKAKLITTGNVEDHLDRLAEADWIAEAVIERLEVKQALYEKIDAVRKPGALVSSNTSTIPLNLLTEAMSARLVPDFCITHFFNPVRYMRLLEMVAGPKTRPEAFATLSAFCDEVLGKGVVHCNDTPGFLANRVGCYALQVAMVEAEALGLTVEEADAIMGRPMGIPKTGVFGLYDLIGLDLMQDVSRSLRSALPADDPFQAVADGIAVTHRLVGDGHTGLKGGGGFYRETGDAGRQAVDLASGHYRAAERPRLDAAAAGESEGLKALVEWPDIYGNFARRVLARVLSYAASLVPEVTGDPDAIDEAMKLGYNWAQGPFEMIDALGVDWFREGLARDGLPVPAFLEAAAGRSFYRAETGRLEDLRHDGAYHPVDRAPGVVRLGDIMRTGAPLLDNGAARLWDVGEGVACLEFHTKANALVPQSMALLHESLGLVERDFRALVIHNDAPHFSMGVNLEFVLAAAEARDWARLETMLVEFQTTCKVMRDAPFPVVAAPSGMALGGGFEVVVHCDAMVAHANTTMGQVETLVGLIPGGGGGKEILNRWRDNPGTPPGIEAAVMAFRLVGMGETASSPDEARPLRLMLAKDRAVMNRDRLLATARDRALALAEGYEPRPEPDFIALGPAGYEALQGVLDGLEEKGIATPHDHIVGGQLARILCGGDRPAGTPVSEDEVFALERETFLHLAGTAATLARIRHMLDHGKPLRN